MRRALPLAVLLAALLALAGIKYAQIAVLRRGAEAAQREGPPPEVVGTAVATQAVWPSVLPAVGGVTAVRGVTVSAEVPGKVQAIHFRSGAKVAAGAPLLDLDTSVERGQLAAARARMELAEANAARSRQLGERGAISRMQLDADEAAAKSAQAEHRSLQAQIGRKVVRAPFAGRLGIRQVNLGQYLQPGTPIVVIESAGAIFVDFSVPQQRAEEVRVGTPVRARPGEDAPELPGEIVAVDPGLESATRSQRLRASVSDPSGALKPGMFVNVRVVLDEEVEVVSAPSTAIVHASYGDSVFVVEAQRDAGDAPRKDDAGRPIQVVRQQLVRLGERRGDFVAIVEGVRAGQVLVTEGAFKLRNDARVVVDDSVGRRPALAPALENR